MVNEVGRCRRRRWDNGRIGGVLSVAGKWCWGEGGHGRRTLVALGEEAERVDLADEVGHAGPSSQPEPHHQHPPHHERVHHVGAEPPPDEPRRPLHCVLQKNNVPIQNHVTNVCISI